MVIAIAILSLAGITACTPNDSIKVPKIGDNVPNISWTTISGEKIDLNQFKGKWVLLCYWCPCPDPRDGILAIRNVLLESYGRDIEVAVIDDHSSYWPEVTLKDFAKENNLPFYLVEDDHNSIAEITLGSNNTHSRPAYFLIDTVGKLNAIKLGSLNYAEGQEAEVIKFLHYEALKVGDIAPAFTAITSLGNRINLSQLKGNWVLLHFVCGCPSEIPDLAFIKYAYEYYDNLKTIVVIDWAQCGGDIADFAQYNKPELNLVEDTDTSLMKIYRLPKTGRPQSFLIDENGFIRARLSQFFHDTDTVKSFLKDIPAINNSTFAAPHIFNAKISNITDKSAELYWETDKEATNIATLSPTNNSGQKVFKLHEDDNFTKKHTLILDSLVASKKYHIVLKSEDVVGRFNSYELEFSTQPSNYAYGTKILNVYFTDITDRSVKLNWSTTKSTFCIISRMGVSDLQEWADPHHQELPTSLYEPQQWEGTEPGKPRKPSINHSWRFIELQPETEYTVQIKVPYEAWGSVWGHDFQSVSDVYNFKTLKSTDKVDMK